MQATTHLIRAGEIDQWDQALYAFLAEKERRSGSMRTVQSYSRMLQHFFGLAHKTPDHITSPEVFSWAHGIGLSGKRPSSITNRRPPRLPLVVLQVPHPHGADAGQSLRGHRAAEDGAYDAIVTALAAWGKDLATMHSGESLWPSEGSERGITSGTFYGNLRRYLKKAGLPLSGVHIFRHSAASCGGTRASPSRT